MKKKVWILSVVIIFLSLGGYFYLSNDRRQPLPTLGSDLKANLVGWVQEHYLSPEEYVLSKFQEHDFVFLGEHHRILHDVELIQALIPLLFENGIYHLGIEFANFADQELIDELITAPTYDQDLAYEIQFRQWPFWGYKEYIDIFRVAWQVNQGRASGTPAFRVVGLNAISDFSYLTSETDRSDPEVVRKISPQGDSDTFMAQVILDEFARPGHKALIYMGINHAYTRYYQPVYNEETGDIMHLMRNRAGNFVYREVGDRAFTIFLHAPWPSKDGYGEQNVYPVDGVIDALISELPPELRRSGFDVRGTPFGDLTSTDSMWQNGYHEFTLADYVDGYIIQGPLALYTGVSVAPGFFTEENRLAANAQNANPATKDRERTVKELEDGLRASADMRRRLRFFH